MQECVRLRRLASAAAALIVGAALVVGLGAAGPLRIYFIDVEGGQSTLIVTPAGQALLIDTGFPGEGTFASHPGEPRQARDANRILAAARDAGLSRIDFLLITHAHADHIGGVTELAQQIPIGTFIDNGGPLPEAESVPGTLQAFKWYEAVRGKAPRLQPKPGDHLPLKEVDAAIVSAAGATLAAPLPGAGEHNASCGASAQPPQEPNENPRSLGVRLQFGQFTFLDPGDLSGAPLFALACPNDMVGPVDVYLVAHHGGADAADPATFAALRPRVAVVNNGPMKGGAPNLLAALKTVPGLEDAWQLHHSLLRGAEDVAAERIANVDETTSNWLKLSADADGSFTITNSRTGATKAYPRRSRPADSKKPE
jgi:competence protein ComEC